MAKQGINKRDALSMLGDGMVCNRCQVPLDLDPRWHHIDGKWEHKCADVIGQAGHVGLAIKVPK